MNSKFYNKYKFLLFVGLLSILSSEVSAVAFRGRLFSRAKNQGEAGLTVVVVTPNAKIPAQTDAEGYFDVEVPALGTYTFRVLRPTGIQELEKAVTADGEVITLYTDKAPKPKGGIDVEGQKDKTILSRYKVRYDEIKRMPGTLGEALNAIQTLPGVFAPPAIGGGNGGCFGGIVIRGADCRMNTYLYDDLPIYYAYHFDTINSVIHNDLIKTIDIYTGAYPANFNNATGGVVEIESNEAAKKATGSFNMSFLLGQAMYQTPILNGKGYLAAGGKIGYLDKTLGSTGLIPDGIRLPQYNSSNVKFIYNFNANHQISFTSLTALDGFVLNAPGGYGANDPTKQPLSAVAGASVAAGQGFRTMGLRYIWTPSTKFSNRITLINYEPFNNTTVKFGSIEADFRASAPYSGIRQDLVWNPTSYLKIDFGTEGRIMNYNITGYSIRQRDPNNPAPNPYNLTNPDFEKADITQKTQTKYFNAYMTFHFTFGNFKFEPGIRHDYVDYSKQGASGPRFVASYKFEGILKGTTVFGGAGDYNRYPYFDQAISRESGNPNIQFEKARKYGGGIDQQLTEEWSVKGELFKQEFTNLIVNDPYITEAYGLNPDKYQRLQRPIVTNRALNYSNSGTGWAHGYEIYIKKSNRPNSKDWFGWISYTWSQSFRNNNIYNADYDPNRNYTLSAEQQRLRSLVPNSRELIFDYDITHLLSVVYGWRITEEYQIGGRWFYRTSIPYTPVIGDDGGQFRNPYNSQIYWNPRYSNNPYSNDYSNSRRQIPYHRFDIRIDKFLAYEWGYINVYLELINIYMRKNVNGEDFDSTAPYSKRNPGPRNDFFTLQLPSGMLIPFINVGMEARF
ncbi:MAG TPA: TonB-dependent receptor plug domain-containing protein [Leptospiraceae bacterium]|nr:TonB-dependent receptor plug domain-containing protein [Leptospiraceae bacterium]HMY29775.1 TonB-dependent receptor plug domain-containing protein [Leptospiraceae bacterium]HMZ62826.1 TonB-dependent receptor plug domain-containing protein [Leptospiraceae bacterium]HNA06925.1 TonB-dependent receptor plug domain-containing protein [Leptospiraceae bacterium]HNB96741.1 TonB-dependent receptor plug domain-containing protein [Leptospiraceae bacterium]